MTLSLLTSRRVYPGGLSAGVNPAARQEKGKRESEEPHAVHAGHPDTQAIWHGGSISYPKLFPEQEF